MKASLDSFKSRVRLEAGGGSFDYFRLETLEREAPGLGRLPFSLRILLENLLRAEDGSSVTRDDILALARWDPAAEPVREIAFRPARVLLQDFTGVPVVVDLAAMRDQMTRLGGDAARINPLEPAEMVIDHSVQVDAFGSPSALAINTGIEFERNRERYAFLRWGQEAFTNLKVVPPGMGIVHQVNLEYLARVVFAAHRDGSGRLVAYPDTLVGTDSHTTMINGLGVLGWGVGGIEAEAALLGQPVTMLIPQVVGFKLRGKLAEGTTATDLVLTVTQILRRTGVVGKFVEFFGPGLAELPLADRATIANMAPEYGATCGFFPVDGETLRYLRLTGRDPAQVELVEAYLRAQGLFADPKAPEPAFTEVLELDLGTVEPSVAGPRRPQDRIALGEVASGFRHDLPALLGAGGDLEASARAILAGQEAELRHGAVVIAAITSCTNTSNPSVMLAAGLLARKAVEAGLSSRPWVKTSLAPGSQVVTAYLERAGLTPFLERLGFHTVGYGCTTCIGNSGPLPEAISAAIEQGKLVVASVLSGNRNFEGRVHGEVRANYLMSPPLVVAYALAGRIDLDLKTEPLGQDPQGRPVYLRDLWPGQSEVALALGQAISGEMYSRTYQRIFEGDERWRTLTVPAGGTFAWEPDSTYVRRPPYFDGMPAQPEAIRDILAARVLGYFGDSITTDHISPAGSIKSASPAGAYLKAHGIDPLDFNSYGARRGNHEVMVRGTFANPRIRNKLTPAIEGGVTRLLPGDEVMTIFEASQRYRAAGTALIVLAGAEYGSGSSRDWAAKGPALLGVRAVLARSFERIHRSNLVGMGILPLEFLPGEDADSHGLTGEEVFDLLGIEEALSRPRESRRVTVAVRGADGLRRELVARARIDTPQEIEYYRHGGILLYVLRQLVAGR